MSRTITKKQGPIVWNIWAANNAVGKMHVVRTSSASKSKHNQKKEATAKPHKVSSGVEQVANNGKT